MTANSNICSKSLVTKSRTNQILALKPFLDEKLALYNNPGFIELDPISVPHSYSRQQDIEIAALFAATLAWGQRVTIIRKCRELLAMMDNDPYQFILHHKETDLRSFEGFKHRTFNATDTLYFIRFLRWFYARNKSLEDAFVVEGNNPDTQLGLAKFHNLFFSLPDSPHRTKKHVATPERKSTCKRLNMFLRWMVRNDGKGVDFGLWNKLKPSQLICPCDLHVDRVARRFKLIERKPTDWLTAIELTGNLRLLDSQDPIKYDFALFGLGIEESRSKLRRLKKD
ncbi:MAG: TIGR02757 family protein [Chryseolinea sp.]